MNDQKQQVVEKLTNANNVLVTVPANPSVDQLAACIGITLLLNKMGKHATAVFSGQVPPTIDFLKPEETLEKTTDSLRDFIIAIDKAKADKLRYKVEDEVVKIFITPFKHSIGEKDLIYSQGDFNVDVVLALGVTRQQDVDAAITSHGRILHDAAVISISNTASSDLGSVNWTDTDASGVSELVSDLTQDLGKDLLDKQISTALLTGVVAETDHFGNGKTTPQVMTVSAALLAAGANQQLVSKQLGHGLSTAPDKEAKADPHLPELQVTEPEKPETDTASADEKVAGSEDHEDSLEAILQQPDAIPDNESFKLPEPKSEPDEVAELPGLNLDDDSVPEAPDVLSPPKLRIDGDETLTEIEKTVHSPHVEQSGGESADNVDSARKAVEDALGKTPGTAPDDTPVSSDAIDIDLDLGHEEPSAPVAPAAPVTAASDSGLPDYLMTPVTTPPIAAPQPTPGPNLQASSLPLNPAFNEPAPLNNSPADQPFTMPLPPSGIQVPPPLAMPSTSTGMPPQGPPPPPSPPPMAPPLPQ